MYLPTLDGNATSFVISVEAIVITYIYIYIHKTWDGPDEWRGRGRAKVRRKMRRWCARWCFSCPDSDIRCVSGGGFLTRARSACSDDVRGPCIEWQLACLLHTPVVCWLFAIYGITGWPHTHTMFATLKNKIREEIGSDVSTVVRNAGSIRAISSKHVSQVWAPCRIYIYYRDTHISDFAPSQVSFIDFIDRINWIKCKT